jgi:hypothetical protein
VLIMAEYEEILQIMKNMAQGMERSPHEFAGMGEETLRSHFLVQRNGVYEGQATRETFNFEGNTDILIRVACDTFGAAMPNVEEAQPIVSVAEACHTLAWSADKEFLAGGHPGWCYSAVGGRERPGGEAG